MLTIGRIVHYRLGAEDVRAINRRRTDAAAATGTRDTDGAQVHVGNTAMAGARYPALVVAVFGGATTANLQVFLDGNDSYWATSRVLGDGEGQWSWPERVPA